MNVPHRPAMHDAASGSPGLTTTLIVFTVLLSAALLTYFDKIGGDAFIGLAATIVGGVLVRSGVATGSQASTAPPAPEA